MFTLAARVPSMNPRGIADKASLFYDKAIKELYKDFH